MNSSCIYNLITFEPTKAMNKILIKACQKNDFFFMIAKISIHFGVIDFKFHLYITNELIYYANRMRKMDMAYTYFTSTSAPIFCFMVTD